MTDPGAHVRDLYRSHVAGDGIALIELSQGQATRSVRYAKFDQMCSAVAAGLLDKELAKDARIGILSANRLEFAATLFGAMHAGLVPVPINTRLQRTVISQIAEENQVTAFFSDAECEGLVPEGRLHVGFDAAGDNGFESFLRNDSSGQRRTNIALQPLTSGSSGSPKGVLLTHEGLIWNNRAVVEARGLRPRDRSLIAAPLYHMNGLNTLMQTLTAGGSAVLMPRFDPVAYLQAIADHRVTLLAGVPTMFTLILEQADLIKQLDLSSVTRIGFGSAPASPTLLERLKSVFPEAIVENNYGITEGGPVVFGPHPDGLPRPENSVGHVLPNVEAKLVGPDDKEAETGVLHLRNPGVMLGYYKRPRETEKRMTNGWLNTGDVFRRDENGFYTFIGRSDDMFICAGENIAPSEVASLLECHPDIAQAAVVAIDDEVKGQVPCAFVVRRTGADMDEPSVRDFALAHGPAFAHPRKVLFLDAMPLAGTGKVDTSALSRIAAGTASQNGGA